MRLHVSRRRAHRTHGNRSGRQRARERHPRRGEKLPMKWAKKGLIFSPQGQHDWVSSHAMLPIADRIDGDLYRIYFSGRDRGNRSLIGYVEVDINNPTKILKLATEPVLGLGALGAFDDNGVSPTWLVNKGQEKYLY